MHQDTPEFVEKTLSDPTLLEFIGTNFVFWIASIRDPEGCRVASYLSCTTYPFFAVCGQYRPQFDEHLNMETTSQTGLKYLLIDKIQGMMSAEALIERLGSQLELHSELLTAARATV